MIRMLGLRAGGEAAAGAGPAPPPPPPFDRRNLGFSGATARGQLRWAWAFTMPVCARNAAVTGWWSAAALITVLVLTIVQAATRSAAAAAFVAAAAAGAAPLPAAACRAATACAAPPWGEALGDWAAAAALLYFATRFVVVCSTCRVADVAVLLNETSRAPALVSVCWAAHVLALTPSAVELAIIAAARGPDDLDVTVAASATRFALLLLDLLLTHVPVLPEHGLYAGMELLALLAWDAYRQAAFAAAPSYAAMSFAAASDLLLRPLLLLAAAAAFQAAFAAAAAHRDRCAGVSVFDAAYAPADPGAA